MVEIYPHETCQYGDGMAKPMRGNENQTLMYHSISGTVGQIRAWNEICTNTNELQKTLLILVHIFLLGRLILHDDLIT